MRDNAVRDQHRLDAIACCAAEHVSRLTCRRSKATSDRRSTPCATSCGEAASALGRSRPDAMTEALNKARDLARGMESMDQRMRERAQQGRQGQQGQQGQQGNEASKGTQASAGVAAGFTRIRSRRDSRAQQGQQGSAGPAGFSSGQQGQGQGQAQEGQQGRQGGSNEGQRTAGWTWRRRRHVGRLAKWWRRMRRPPARSSVARGRPSVPRRGPSMGQSGRAASPPAAG